MYEFVPVRDRVGCAVSLTKLTFVVGPIKYDDAMDVDAGRTKNEKKKYAKRKTRKSERVHIPPSSRLDECRGPKIRACVCVWRV